jgi:hypothetical protein
MDSALPTALQALTEEWTGQLLDLIVSLAPKHIAPYVRVEPQVSGNQYTIRITVNRFENPKPNYGSLDARAQEYGSGLRARRGGQHIIKIVPTQESGWLIFKGTKEYQGMVIKTKEVNHPGIEAANSGQGYIAPAVNAVRAEGRAELSQAVRGAILSDIRRSFGRA